jgi:hypothetical protein
LDYWNDFSLVQFFLQLAGAVSQETKLFGSRLCYLPVEAGRVVQLDGTSQPGRVNDDGLFIPGTDGRWVNVRMLQVGIVHCLILKNKHLLILKLLTGFTSCFCHFLVLPHRL